MQKIMLVLASMGALLASAGLAQAERIAGWDFSQYKVAGLLTIDGTTNINSLDANYSVFDPSQGAGSDAAAYGTMVMDGTLGSTNVAPAPGADVVPTPRSAVLGYTSSNYSGGVQGNIAGFDQFGVLSSEGQVNTEFLGLLANVGSTVVFAADLTPAADTASGWSVSFGGETLVGTANVSVSFDVGCDGGIDVGPAVVALDTSTGALTQTVNFAGANITDAACFQFAMDGGAVIDNVSIDATPVPEPGMIALLMAGIGGLLVLHRQKV